MCTGCVHICMYMNVDTQRRPKKVSVPLELELQVAASCSMWVMGTELSTRAVSTLNLQL